MVIFEEINGKLVPHGSEEDIKAYLDYVKEQKKKKKVSKKKSGKGKNVFSRMLDKLPVSRLDRYLIGKYLGTYFFSMTLIILIAVVFDFNENIDKFLQHEAPVNEIVFDYYLSFVPFYSNMFSQLFVFIAVIFFTTKLAGNSEIIAMMASGVSFNRLIRPYLISAAFIAVINFGLGAYVIPKSNVKRVAFENKYKNRGRQDLSTNVMLEVDSGVIAYIGRYEDSYKMGYEFTLDQYKDKKLIKHLQAMCIQYDSLSYEPGHWIVQNYQTRDLQGMREVITSGNRLDTLLNMQPQDLLVSRDMEMTMTNPELESYIAHQKARGFANIQAFEIEYYKRGASAFAVFIMTVIGVSISARKRKNGLGIALGLGFVWILGYIMFQTVSSSFAKNAGFPPMLAVWLPNIFYTLVALYYYRKAPR